MPNSLTPEKLNEWKQTIAAAWTDPEQIKNPKTQQTLVAILRALEHGTLRVVSPLGTEATHTHTPLTGDLRSWDVHAWVKQAVLLTLRWRTPRMSTGVTAFAGEQSVAQGRIHGDALVFHDKLDTRSDHAEMRVRVVPPGVVREGAYMAPGAILMPGYVNIGAYVGQGTMVDTWATVGSCAQIGANVHLAGGVGIGGVLEPANARPVIVGDNAFVGSRAIVVEGAVISAGAVLGANVCITATTPIYDVTSPDRIEYRGYVPPNAVVAPGTRSKSFPGGDVQLQCSYIIAWRNDRTDSKVSLNEVLRETGIAV
ncbi:MAG: 2,3,4,5-tetrahydropyridine-2,6-dicarboxylate N-succinyltransferase [Betaproteobacteria bacterium]|nr:2,3,4,5-tetrahydropyridine-2,6-dicarboxylate N-succinyltransferase [Betaproteobacteria bacterium]